MAATCSVLVGAAYASQSGSSADGGFAVDALTAAQVPQGGVVSQPVRGLWTGDQPLSFVKVAGPDWLSVTSEGVVTGTVPSDVSNQSVVVTVQAAGQSSSDSLQVVVPVLAGGAAQHLEVASLNLDDAGANAASGAEQKVLSTIAGEGIQVLGVQESGAFEASELANELGWHSWQATASQGSGDLGIVSAYPISNVTPPTASVPAAAVTLDVNGAPVRVWVTHLDESDYGPTRACSGATDVVTHELGTTRYAQAQAVASAMGADVTAAAGSGTPVIMLGDLASPSGSDWTSATSAAHCNAGAVNWPVPAAFDSAGLTDSFRVANPDPTTDAGPTWPSVAADSTEGPADRIDYVDYAGGLTVLGAESYYTGWTGPGGPSTDWPSDHAAAVTLFQLPATALTTPPSTVPTTSPSTAPTTSNPVNTKPQKFTAGTATIAGTAQVGSTVTASVTGFAPTPSTYSYQWLRNGAAISGATKPTYAVVAADDATKLTVRVTASATGFTSKAVTSVASRVVDGQFASPPKPKITGTAVHGQTLTATTAAWSPKPSLTYQWYADGNAIKSATTASYKVAAKFEGERLTVSVTGSKAGYATVTVTSAQTGVVK
ncbi:hypothetical protein GCM10023322_33310 [Rugosimonospora acidiphila]|uniref:Endonuclease/exonuclease/phosphatase domain-containing protein n=1 Tax=Rugosimonospora acidiphila TaxID=556531 RepID=A0ABP9RT33_9ACTN